MRRYLFDVYVAGRDHKISHVRLIAPRQNKWKQRRNRPLFSSDFVLARDTYYNTTDAADHASSTGQ